MAESPSLPGPPDPPPQPPRQRQTTSPDQDAFHRRVPCIPRQRLRTTVPARAGLPRRLRIEAPHALAWNEDDEETIACRAEALPATNRLRCSRARGCSPPRSGYRRPFTRRASPSLLTERSAGGLDPRAPWLEAVKDQTPLVDFCNTNNPRAPPANRPIPTSPSIPSSRLRASLAPRAFAREDRSLHPTPGLRPEPGLFSVGRQRLLLRCRWRGIETSVSWSRLSPRARPRMASRRSPFQHHPGSCDPERSHWRVRHERQPRFHGPGADGFRRQHVPLGTSRSVPPGGMRAQELRPNPIRSDTSCRGITAIRQVLWGNPSSRQPEGDSDFACDPTEGRITRASAKKTEIRRTRGAFHR